MQLSLFVENIIINLSGQQKDKKKILLYIYYEVIIQLLGYLISLATEKILTNKYSKISCQYK